MLPRSVSPSTVQAQMRASTTMATRMAMTIKRPLSREERDGGSGGTGGSGGSGGAPEPLVDGTITCSSTTHLPMTGWRRPAPCVGRRAAGWRARLRPVHQWQESTTRGGRGTEGGGGRCHSDRRGAGQVLVVLPEREDGVAPGPHSLTGDGVVEEGVRLHQVGGVAGDAVAFQGVASAVDLVAQELDVLAGGRLVVEPDLDAGRRPGGRPADEDVVVAALRTRRR